MRVGERGRESKVTYQSKVYSQWGHIKKLLLTLTLELIVKNRILKQLQWVCGVLVGGGKVNERDEGEGKWSMGFI
jgi:hypothetical protein